jgi:hypothetical protein
MLIIVVIGQKYEDLCLPPTHTDFFFSFQFKPFFIFFGDDLEKRKKKESG